MNTLARIFSCAFVSNSEGSGSGVALCVLNLGNQIAIQRGESWFTLPSEHMRTGVFIILQPSGMPEERGGLSELGPELQAPPARELSISLPPPSAYHTPGRHSSTWPVGPETPAAPPPPCCRPDPPTIRCMWPVFACPLPMLVPLRKCLFLIFRLPVLQCSACKSFSPRSLLISLTLWNPLHSV